MARRFIFLAVLAAVLLLAAGASALTLSVEDTTQPQLPPVSFRTTNDRWCLYLPGTWNLTAVRMAFDGADSITIGGETYENGQVYDFSWLEPGKRTTLKIAPYRKEYPLQLYHGSRIASVYFEVDQKALSTANAHRTKAVKEGAVTFVEADGTVSYRGGLTQLKARGNTTFKYPKKPYQFKTAEKAGLCGMGAAKTWVLLANWLDISLLRNQLALDLAKAVGVPFAIDCAPVDVYLNGQYNGLYLLCEKVQIGRERIDITDLEKANAAANPDAAEPQRVIEREPKGDVALRYSYAWPADPEDITGGYLLEIEKNYRFESNETNGFMLWDQMAFTVKEPEQASAAEIRYISDTVCGFHKAVLAEDGREPVSGRYYQEYIDVTSFANVFLIEDFTKDFDAQQSSLYLFKDSDAADGRLYAGPCWDFDLCWGNPWTQGFQKGLMPTGLHVVNYEVSKSLWYTLSKHGDFMTVVRQRWRDGLRPAVEVLLGLREPENGCPVRPFEAYRDTIAASAEMNARRWPPENVTGYNKHSGKTFDASAAWLRQFIEKRYAFLCEYWPE